MTEQNPTSVQVINSAAIDHDDQRQSKWPTLRPENDAWFPKLVLRLSQVYPNTPRMKEATAIIKPDRRILDRDGVVPNANLFSPPWLPWLFVFAV